MLANVRMSILPIGIATSILFNNRAYLVLAIGIFGVFWIAFNILDQLFFLSVRGTFMYPLTLFLSSFSQTQYLDL